MLDQYLLRQQALLNLSTRKFIWRGDGSATDTSHCNKAMKLLCGLQQPGEGKIDADEVVPEVSTEEQTVVMLEEVVDLTMEQDEQMDGPEFNLDLGEPDLQRFWIQEDDCDITICCYKRRRQTNWNDDTSACKRPNKCLFCKTMETSRSHRKYRMLQLPSICIFWRKTRTGRTSM